MTSMDSIKISSRFMTDSLLRLVSRIGRVKPGQVKERNKKKPPVGSPPEASQKVEYYKFLKNSKYSKVSLAGFSIAICWA